MIYIIYKVEFDNYENHDPYYEDVLGYINDYHDACSLIATFVRLDLEEKKTYTGYDGVVYPRYHFKKVIEMSASVINAGDYRRVK